MSFQVLKSKGGRKNITWHCVASFQDYEQAVIFCMRETRNMFGDEIYTEPGNGLAHAFFGDTNPRSRFIFQIKEYNHPEQG